MTLLLITWLALPGARASAAMILIQFDHVDMKNPGPAQQGPSSIRADSRLAPSQWETSLQSNAVSHWLGASLELALSMISNLQTCALTEQQGSHASQVQCSDWRQDPRQEWIPVWPLASPTADLHEPHLENPWSERETFTETLVNYCQTYNIRCTKSLILNVSRLFLQLSLPNPLKPGVKLRMRM